MDALRAWGESGSTKAYAEPLRRTPNTATMAHLDFSKHKGMIVPGGRSSARKCTARLVESSYKTSAGYGVFGTRLKVYRKVTQRWWPQYSDFLTPDKLPQLTTALVSGVQVVSGSSGH